MSFINICRENTDPFYRYKMPPIQSKIEGRGNGIKTAVVNLAEVSRALNRPPSYVLKYFGSELGAQTKEQRFLVNGQHDSAKLQDLLDGFINRFVLCGACKNPETEILIGKDDSLTRDCKACGKRTTIDPRHKLATFILKNPPLNATKGSKKSATASANVVGGGVTITDLASGTTKSASDQAQADEGDVSDDDELARRFNAEAQLLPEAAPVNDDDWAVDMSEELIAQRAKELEGLSVNDKSLDEFEEFGEWLYKEDKLELPSDVEIYKKASELSIVDKPETLTVIVQCLFDEDIEDQIEQHQGLLNKLITSKKHEKLFLGGLERLVGVSYPDLMAKLPKILMKVYDEDLISEESLIKWGTTVSVKYLDDKKLVKKIKRSAGSFIKWLQEADEESDDE